MLLVALNYGRDANECNVLWHAQVVMCIPRIGKAHSAIRTRGSRKPASCGSFVDVFFVARKQAPLSSLTILANHILALFYFFGRWTHKL